MKKKVLCFVGIVVSVLFLFSCASSKTVDADIIEQYSLTPVEEIITSERTVQELMLDTRQYFKKNYRNFSTEGNQTDTTHISTISKRFYPTVKATGMGQILYTCDFTVNVEFKDDGRIRFSTENIYIGQVRAQYGKYRFGGNDWIGTALGLNSTELRILAGKTYNTIINQMKETFHKIATGKSEYSW